ncbi:MAG TPA: hypothetical protein VM553_00305 [Dongiaceae bacterium]|nr:hypothetical protein [Dongiaceae bacterium]
MPKNKEKEDEFFIKKRQLNALFDSTYPLNINLWRGQKPDERGNPIFYPILKSFLLSNGNVRDPDIETYEVSGELWVNAPAAAFRFLMCWVYPTKNGTTTACLSMPKFLKG